MTLRVWVIFLLFSAHLSAQTHPGWTPLTYAPGPADNPLKGFMPYRGVYTTFPYSMEYSYIAWKDIQSGYDTFTWTAIDNLLADVSSRGHHTVFRVYADYPKKPYGVPAFLDSIPKHAYTDNGNTTSFSPDYDNANLRRAMLNLIAAMGARYDGDPRIGFIEIGFLGFWGEWHTYPHTEWFASTVTQNMVLDAFEQAFHKTQLVMREPKPGSSMPARKIGYHDDSFCYSTYGTVAGASWYFWPKVLAAGERQKWQSRSIGGELRPEIQLSLWTDACACVNGESGLAMQYYDVCVDSTHASWMLAGNLFTPGNSGTEHARALAGARRLGYDLFVAAVSLADTAGADSCALAITMKNAGHAPFAYPWLVQLAIANDAKVIVRSQDLPWDITKIMDTTAIIFSGSLDVGGLNYGRYTLLLRAVDPMPGGVQLAFANVEWGTDVQGWLSLGTFTFARPTDAGKSSPSRLQEYDLAQNYPNPFNPSTVITYRVPVTTHVHIAVYDLLGREVRGLVNAARPSGSYEVVFDATGLAGGVYLCRMEAGTFARTRTLVLVR